MIASIWILKLILAHLLTDFILQPSSWVSERNSKHFSSSKLYLHCLLTSLVAWTIIGWQYWLVALIIFITHLFIDVWKSYQKSTIQYFLLDQLMHLIVIVACWYFTFITWDTVEHTWQSINSNPGTWKIITAFIFLTSPAGIFIGQFTKRWRVKIDHEESLANAGKWIGMTERIIILVFVLKNQYAAISLLVAAKAIIRFNEKDRPELKTEYLVIGTLISILMAIVTGLLVKA